MDGFIICTPTGDDFGVKGSRCGDRSDLSDMNYAFLGLSSSCFKEADDFECCNCTLFAQNIHD